MKNKYLNIIKDKLNDLPKVKYFSKKDLTSNLPMQAGFTLIEIIVVVSIIVIITTISMFQFASNKKGIYVENTAEEIVLALRKAQSLALAVHSPDPVIARYNNGYGVHFELGGLGGYQDANDHSYIIFMDYEAIGFSSGWDRAYLKSFNITDPCGSPSQGVNECLEKNEITTGDRITKLEICSTSGGTPVCSSLSTSDVLDVTFLRPSLDASFCVIKPSGGGCPAGSTMSDFVKITVSSANGSSRTVTVWSTGHISVE